MIQPSIDKLLEEADSKYSLAVVAAKRARELVDGAVRLTDAPTNKSVSIALCEIGEGHVSYTFNDDVETEIPVEE
ncbi:DNA-directed RNA polymerase subunit omega [Peptococcus simiae]|uniref:DNA-directed RNA polymerase subunit omega n=1 Tax=Peptococcus simiae TaxID=1643805 RepID=UPI003980797C